MSAEELLKDIFRPREIVEISSSLYAEVDAETWGESGTFFLTESRPDEDAIEHDVVICIEDIPALMAALLRIYCRAKNVSNL